MSKRVRQPLRALEDALLDLMKHGETDEVQERIDEAVREARWQAWGYTEENKQAKLEKKKPVRFSTVIATNLRYWRVELAGWTQEQLSQEMNRLGLKWTRVTVAEIEGETRQASLDELLLLAALFGVPMVEFLLLGNDQDYQLPDGRVIDGGQINDLIAGPGCKPEWDQEWHVAAWVGKGHPSKKDSRPARDIGVRLFEESDAPGRMERWNRRDRVRTERRPGPRSKPPQTFADDGGEDA